MTKTTEAKWRAIIREQERSGLTVREFSGRRGLSPSTVFWWRCKLRRKLPTEAPALVPVDVVETSREDRSAAIGLELGDGIVVRIPRGVDEADLQRVLRALGRRC